MFCADCGEKLLPGGTFCSKCGSRIPGSGSLSVQQSSSSYSTLAITAFVLSFLIPIVGLVLGIVAQREIDASGGRLGGRGLAVAAVVINVIWIVAIFIWFGFFASILGSTSSYYKMGG